MSRTRRRRVDRPEEATLAEHGVIVGSPRMNAKSASRAMLRGYSSNLTEQTRTSISAPQTAELLRVDAG